MATENVSPNTNTPPPPASGGSPGPAPTPDPGAPPSDLLAVIKGNEQLHSQFTSFVSGKLREQDAARLRQIQALEAQVSQVPQLQAKLAELQEAAEGKTKSTEQRYQAQLAQLEQQRQALAQQKDQAEARARELEQRRADDYRRSFLMGLAAESGAAPSAIADIPFVFPTSHVQVEATPEGGFQAKLVDPQTGLAHADPRAAFAAWLGTKPHLKAAIPGGAGQHGGAPPTNKPIDFDALPIDQQIELGLKGYRVPG
ncbi:MAG: hypothetical protein MUF10_11240 [Thermoanaerobaculaceae bacterium]|jgi:hypothetical protein|nr:hypothetical protein [Thermoanaerobaculaceae bacterium]